MTTMTKAARKQERIQNICRAVSRALESVTGKTPDRSDVIALVQRWHRAAERIRHRLENECNYEWANTEAYGKETARLTDRLEESVQASGLHCYIQGDCRGALLYVDAKPIPDDDYQHATCVSFD